jgi:hypothetical protein
MTVEGEDCPDFTRPERNEHHNQNRSYYVVPQSLLSSNDCLVKEKKGSQFIFCIIVYLLPGVDDFLIDLEWQRKSIFGLKG